jgi:O-antigen/teichoic acid export membrane protein
MSATLAFLPWLLKPLKNHDPRSDYKIVSAIVGLIIILGASTVAYVIAFKFIFPLVIGKTFARGDLLLGQLAWANFFLGIQMTMNCFLYYRKQTITSAISVCLAAASGLALGLWLIPSGGALAAAYVTELSAALAAAITTISVLWNFAPTFRNGAYDLLGRVYMLRPSRLL